MKKFLAILMTLMIVSTMVLGMVAYADEPVEGEEVEVQVESTEGEVSEPEQELPELTEEDQASLKQSVIIDMSGEELKLQVYITGTDGLLEYYKAIYMIYYQTDVPVVEFDGAKALLMNDNVVTEANLNAQGIGLIEKEGFFADKTKGFAVDTSVSSNYEEGTEVITYKIIMPTRLISAENADVQKNTVVKTIIAGQNNNFMFTYTKINWINCLIGLMILAVIVLLVLIVIFSKKKKPMPEKIVDEIKDKVEEIAEKAEENIEPAKEKVEDIIEEVKEEITEAIEEVKEEIAEAKEEKTEE